MLRDLTIQNYRCFRDFHVDGLAQVNLIVGKNSVGKTSLLEAIYLLTLQGKPPVINNLLQKRREITHSTGPLFHAESLFRVSA